MKTIVICYIAVLLPILLFSQRETDGRTRNLVRLGNTTITIVNNFITDSGRKVNPTFIQYPFSKEAFTITGSRLFISTINIDSTEHLTGWWNGNLIDSVPADKKLFSLSDIQIRIYSNHTNSLSWKDVASFPLSYLNAAQAVMKSTKPQYILFDDTLAINETISIEIRSKLNTNAVFQMRFLRVALPLTPFLAMNMQDSSSTRSEAEFIKNAIETGNQEFKSINSFYKDWPASYGKGNNNNNQPYFSTTKLAFYFRKPTENYPDSSLQYAVLDNYDTDTIWNTSGHLILITRLQAGHHYTLLARYKQAPENLWQNHFYVAPKWYQTNSFFYGAIIFVFLLSVFIIILIIHRKKIKREKQKLEKLQLEQQAIRSQLNPHFTFNALSSIQSLMNQNKIEEANYYFTQFSSLLRESLRANNRDMLPLQVELQTLESYIKLEQLRFPFYYSFFIDEAINPITTEVPSLLLQPLVENAIKHGISGLQKEGNISIDIKADNGNMIINIRDNGKGFHPKENNNGYGLSLTKERLSLLSQMLPEQQITMTINSQTTGTAITLQFINWLL